MWEWWQAITQISQRVAFIHCLISIPQLHNFVISLNLINFMSEFRITKLIKYIC